MKLSLKEAHAILRLEPGSHDRQAVMRAWATAVAETHPDVGGTPDAYRTQGRLKEARDMLLGHYTGTTDQACPTCKGTGWMRVGGWKPLRCPKGCRP